MVTITCYKASWVEESNPTYTHGTDTVLDTSWIGGTYVHKSSLLGFDISSISGVVSSAILHIKTEHATDATKITFKRITDNTWTENSVCWNNKPSITSTNKTSRVFVTAEDETWVSIDVTNMFNDESSDDFSIWLENITNLGRYVDIYSDDSPNNPYIVVTTAPTDKYVDISTGSDSDSGNTWTDAYLTVKMGIDNLPTSDKLHIAFGDYSSQAAINLNQNIELICEDNGGGGTGTVTLPPTT